MSSELRTVHGRTEFYENNVQQTINGERIANVDPDYPTSQLFADFYGTELGEQFLETYDLDTINPRTGLTNAQTVEKSFAKLYSHDLRMTLTRVTDTIRTAIDAGALTPKPEEEVVTPARDEQGRFADQQGLLRSEVRRMLDDPSTPASALRARASKDAAFRMAMEAEMTPTAPVQPTAPEDIENLEDFAERWRRCPNPKPIAGKVKLDQYTEYTVPELSRLLERCAAAGVL